MAHVIQSLTDLDCRPTVMSIDGISPFRSHFQSRNVGWSVKRQGRGVRFALRAPVLHRTLSIPLDGRLRCHSLHSPGGRERTRGRSYAHVVLFRTTWALESIQDSLQDDEHLFRSPSRFVCRLLYPSSRSSLRRWRSTRLDDLYVVCSPERVDPIFKIIAQALEEHARIQVHLGKTQVWNRGGHYPPGCGALQTIAERVDRNARVWRGQGFPVEQGIRVLGIPIGHVEFVEAQFRATTDKHSQSRIFRVRRSCSSSARTPEPCDGPVCSGLQRRDMVLFHHIIGVAVRHCTSRSGQHPTCFRPLWVALGNEVTNPSPLGQSGR